jgi:hypothetical protein
MAVDFDTYDAIGQAEDVQDVVYNVSPVDNPVAAMSRTLRATGKLHEFQEDRLAAAASNVAVEGADAGDDESTPTVLLSNNCQIMDKVARISGTVEEVDKYGRDSEMAYQLELRYGELANDEELAIIGAPGNTRQTSTAGTQDVAGRTMACFQVQILGGPNNATNVIQSAAADIAALEVDLLNAHQGAYDLGGNPGYLIVTPLGARYVSSMAASAGRERDFGTGSELVNVIDLYVSPYGSLDVVLDRHAENNGGVGNNEHIMAGIDFQYSATPVLRATRDYPLAKTGDAENRQIIRESTYALLNRDSGFMVESISPSL